MTRFRRVEPGRRRLVAVTNSTQWAGVPLSQRRTERRDRLVEAAFDILGTDDEAALSVRSVCRACDFNSRYFYESFADTDELLGAVYDRTAAQLADVVGQALSAAGQGTRGRTRAGIHAVLAFASADSRRGRVLFTAAQTNPVLAARRCATEDVLREFTRADDPNGQTDPLTAQIRAALFTGAMIELAQQWLGGELGSNLDAVVDRAIELLV